MDDIFAVDDEEGERWQTRRSGDREVGGLVIESFCLTDEVSISFQLFSSDL